MNKIIIFVVSISLLFPVSAFADIPGIGNHRDCDGDYSGQNPARHDHHGSCLPDWAIAIIGGSLLAGAIGISIFYFTKRKQSDFILIDSDSEYGYLRPYVSMNSNEDMAVGLRYVVRF